MSLPGLPCTGTYEIVSVVGEKGATSVDGLIKPAFQIVRLGLQDKLWDITEKSEDVYQFGIKNVYRYSGILDDKVIATADEPQNVLWQVGPATSRNYFGLVITPKGDFQRGWTVAKESDPESEIAIEKINYSPLTIYPPIIDKPTQLFKFVKVG